ncbi:DNA/RNA-binding protein translin/TB-RBP-like protein [Galdieria sulphuraria]|uniref:DNA/RNA-binding protein translin/TB-RBP-like protein n=1 Tax=Galdieria sulphuraria TaxID=130081 RepID=M2Y744_GALSU|nr:DNA/RNA-binding protein translin/TB-RBP-like protein [Galdieria sulphuraria]EME31838.1 DNA/RNA-binding protein translin/TB-RBP-like protein [Galdieria sulphuraria]|eukprot:XP_005708358.1 DNA/RNA-binding protein translin/TB-RBP-like protein [Galdieria sulphuraria]
MESSFFFKLNDYLEKESQCRENLRECRDRCDAAVRSAAVLVESLHKERDLSSKLQELYESLREVASGFVRLQSNVPVDEYYKYNELWRSSLSQAVAVGCLVYYLDCNQLADIFVLERIFCPKEPEASSVRIELEDYLVGVCNLVGELSRLSVNRVTIGDFEFAVKAAKFSSEVLAGFRLLNFRNDYLRRRFDGMKYDVKKLEEVVYDISIRGLLK